MMPANTSAERGSGRAPEVTVIVPARNEEQCLGRCLESLVGQQGVTFELLVVDDGSTDRTRVIAESLPQVQVLDAGALPAGWTGKNHAVWQGAQRARGRWLLFTDADTVHEPGSLAASVAEAERHGAAMLSYSPRQEVVTFWERALMPMIFAELAATYPPAKVCDPKSPVAAANGQYLMISREAYDAIGGHRAVAGSLLEDVALARRVKGSGRALRFRYGGEAVRTRMYRSLEELCAGWTKNLALLFPHPIWLAVRRSAEFLFMTGCLALAAVAFFSDVQGVFLPIFFAVLAWIGMRHRVGKAHFGGLETDLAVLGLPLFAILLVRSCRRHRAGGNVEWKGRSYPRPAGREVESGPVTEPQAVETIH